MGLARDRLSVGCTGLAKLRVHGTVELAIGGTVLEGITKVGNWWMKHALVLGLDFCLNKLGT